MNKMVSLAALAAAGTLIANAASAADVAPDAQVYRTRVVYRPYAPTPWRADMRDYHFNTEDGGYEQEYKIGACHVKRELEEDGEFTEEVHCQGRGED